MKLAVMQPYFFPYLGYFQLMQSVEHFMFYDTGQYVKQSWMIRNRLINFDTQNPYYIRPDLIHPGYKAMLPSVKLVLDDKWKIDLLRKIRAYKSRAPFFQETAALIEQLLDIDYKYLNDLNIESTTTIARWLGINIPIDRLSEYNFQFEQEPNVRTWAIEVSRAMKATHYINAPGGEILIPPEEFIKSNIKLGFIQPELFPYDQKIEQFISHLSIIDVLMFNGREKTRKQLKEYSIKWMN